MRLTDWRLSHEATLEEYAKLPPDFTLRPYTHRTRCYEHGVLQVCTRRREHTGRHAMGDGLKITSVWS